MHELIGRSPVGLLSPAPTTRPPPPNYTGYLFDVELYSVKVPCIVHVVGACHVAGVVDATRIPVVAMWLPRGRLEALEWRC